MDVNGEKAKPGGQEAEFQCVYVAFVVHRRHAPCLHGTQRDVEVWVRQTGQGGSGKISTYQPFASHRDKQISFFVSSVRCRN